MSVVEGPDADTWREWPLPAGAVRWCGFAPGDRVLGRPAVLTALLPDGSRAQHYVADGRTMTHGEWRAYRAAPVDPVRARIDSVVAYGLRSVPPWEWARVDGADFRRVVAAPLRRVAEKWQPAHGSLVLFGATGTGKTATTIALAHRLAGEARQAQSVADPQVQLVRGICWISALELATARRGHPLGRGEAPEIEAARSATILVLDELGYERHDERDPWLLELVDSRYRRAAPTVLTSGRSRDELEQRYGAACMRRLVERGRGAYVEVRLA